MKCNNILCIHSIYWFYRNVFLYIHSKYMDWSSWKYYQRAKERRGTMSEHRCKRQNTLDNFLCSNWKLHASNIHTVNYSCNLQVKLFLSQGRFSDLLVAFFVYQTMSKASESRGCHSHSRNLWENIQPTEHHVYLPQ